MTSTGFNPNPSPPAPGLSLVTVSTAFHPQRIFPPPYNYPPDIVLLSVDCILFYTHRRLLENKSHNEFGGTIANHRIVGVHESLPAYMIAEGAPVVNCIFHILYGMSSRLYAPDLPTISRALDALRSYGCSLSENVLEGSEIFTDLVAHAADPNSDPLEVFTIAASNSFEELAVPSSHHSLRVPLSSIDDATAIAIGPVYMLRLARLHDDRRLALRNLVQQRPVMHQPTETCDRERQRPVMRAYSLATSQLGREGKPDITGDALGAFFENLVRGVECNICRGNIRERVRGVIEGWERVKKTI